MANRQDVWEREQKKLKEEQAIVELQKQLQEEREKEEMEEYQIRAGLKKRDNRYV